ncbi:hypothetical protein [Micromonospora sp. NPDC005806]|uniref:hypothetical protein n=1 Tax=Micromonospora sp. NPDC005806 TaxID=3364234 RepID=UPI00368F5A85
MAFRTWGRLPFTALGVSVLAGAGQLGIAYGFGVVRLNGAFADGSINRWPAQLAWVGWFAAIAAVAGAVATGRLARRDGSPGGTTEQLSVAGAAALGATVVALLCMQPARTAELGGTVDPVWAVGICAILGALVGAGAAIAVLLKPPFGWNIALTAAAVWVLALVSVAPTVTSNGPLRTVRLGVLEPSWLDAAAAQRLAMLVLPTMALLAGAVTGARARRQGHLPLVAGAAGVAGPALLAFAYLTAGPGAAADHYQLAPYYGALIAVASGALGSAAATVLRRPAPAADTDTDTDTDAIEPTDILQPLPASAATPVASATASGSALAAPSAAVGAADGSGGFGTASDGGSPAPAHWDWPAPSGVTPAPVPAGWTVSGHTASDDRVPPMVPADDATAPVVPVAEAPASAAEIDGRDEVAAREADDLTRNLPVPGLLPAGRRTSAIDVLAAGRPATHPSAERERRGSARPTPSSADLAPPERTPEPPRSAAGAAAPEPAPPAEEQPALPPESASPATDRTAASAEPPAPARAGQRGAERSEGDGGAAPRNRRVPAKTGVTSDPAAAVPSATEGPTTSGLSTAPATPRAGGNELPTSPAPRAAGGRRSRRATASQAEPGAAGTDPTGPDAPRAGGRSKRGRKATTGAVPGSEPVGTTPAEPAAELDVPARPEVAPALPEPASAQPAGADDERTPALGGSSPGPEAATAEPSTTSNFFADEPVGPDVPGPLDTPASPRPRFPIFEDVTDRPGEVRPAWPITPGPSWPVTPRGTTAPGAPGPTGANGDSAAPADEARPAPAPRPRHRALPDLSRPDWDAFDNARPTTPVVPGDSPGHGRHADPDEPAEAAPDPTDPTEAAEATEEPGAGKAKARRGLFRRNRAKGAEVAEPDHESAPLPAKDEEYVDWVAGLASDDDTDDTRTLRTGRHHRD